MLTASVTTPDCEGLPCVGRGSPVSDRALESGVTVWIALRRAHEGGVASLKSQWLDSGRQVPGYVAEALDRLISGGLLVLGEAEPESCGVRRITVTDSGCARYVALCQIHKPRGTASVSTPRRWAHSPHDQRSHLLATRGTDQIGVLIAVCGHRMLWSVDTSAQPTERSCLTCEALATGPVPAPQFGNSPDSGRPPVEQSPRPASLQVPDSHFPHPQTSAGRRSIPGQPPDKTSPPPDGRSAISPPRNDA